MKRTIYIKGIAACACAVLAFALAGCKDNKPSATTDSEGNATEIEATINEDETATEASSAEDATPNVKQERLVREFYRKYVFGNTPYKQDILSHYCSERLMQKLKDDYDYNDGGYAIWDFRTGNQDGPSKESRITSIESISERCMEVRFLDMGIEGSHKIYFLPEGDDWKMDRID